MVTTGSAAEAPYWLQFIQPFGTVFLGIGAFFLGFRQWRTANEKLRLDLFDRRLAAVDEWAACLKLFEGRYDQDSLEHERFLNAMRGVELVFGRDLDSHMVVMADIMFRRSLATEEQELKRISAQMLESGLLMRGEAERLLKISGVASQLQDFRVIAMMRGRVTATRLRRSAGR